MKISTAILLMMQGAVLSACGGATSAATEPANQPPANEQPPSAEPPPEEPPPNVQPPRHEDPPAGNDDAGVPQPPDQGCPACGMG